MRRFLGPTFGWAHFRVPTPLSNPEACGLDYYWDEYGKQNEVSTANGVRAGKEINPANPQVPLQTA